MRIIVALNARPVGIALLQFAWSIDRSIEHIGRYLPSSVWKEAFVRAYRRWKIVTIIGCVDTFINEQLRQRFKSKITEDFIFWLSANNKMCLLPLCVRRRGRRSRRSSSPQSIDVRWRIFLLRFYGRVFFSRSRSTAFHSFLLILFFCNFIY